MDFLVYRTIEIIIGPTKQCAIFFAKTHPCINSVGGADASPTATRREAAASAAGPRYMSPEAQPASPLSIPSPAHHRMLSPAARDANSTSFGPSAMQLQREIVEKVAVSTEGDPPQQLQVDRSDDEDQDSRARAQ
eukprot:GEMP01042127.1.p2 GENE.GEMP01042127.1~~GEMP01042127.1.p2  ORF type:complete len:135 (+),score=29.68 GEMP01042127.1:194-598(+)